MLILDTYLFRIYGQSVNLSLSIPGIPAWVMFILLLPLTACDRENQSEPESRVDHGTSIQPAMISTVDSWYPFFLNIGKSSSTVLLQNAELMDQAILKFIQTPNQENRLAAQQSWSKAHQSFQTMKPAFLFLKHISATVSGPSLKLIDHMDSWPVTPGYLDSIDGYPYSGIVNDVTLPLNKNSLLEQHSFSDQSEASLGLHVIEFFLWGESSQQLKPLEQYRAVRQWQREEEHLPISQHPNNRRRQYLTLLSSIYLESCQNIDFLWKQASQGPWGSAAISSLYANIGEIRSNVGQQNVDSTNATSFSDHPHNLLSTRVEALLKFLSQDPSHDNSNKPFTPNVYQSIHALKQILPRVGSTEMDKPLADKLDFTLTQLESSLYALIDEKKLSAN